MYRKIQQQLIDWKNNKGRKPLLLTGARQTGKTYSVTHFAREHYNSFASINFEKDTTAREIFEGDLDPVRLIPLIENYLGQRILPEETLIFFDEIHSCPSAVTALKYFQESASRYHVIGSGSLLGVAINRREDGRVHKTFSFPVGKVDEMRLYPMNFEEFLLAHAQELLVAQIREHYIEDAPMDPAIHTKALALFRRYLALGGMPEAVRVFLDENSYVASDKVIEAVYNEYLMDTGKYATSIEAVKHKACYESVAHQLFKENKNFKYSKVIQHKSSDYFGNSIDWLAKMGIVYRSRQLKVPERPLLLHDEETLFRIYFSDVGLFRNRMRSSINNILDPEYRDDSTGLLAENYIACELASAGIPLHYWRGKRNAEIEFLVEKDQMVIPIEVKAGKRVTSKSLNIFRQEHKAPFVYRVSQKNFGFDNGIKAVPLYAAFCMSDELEKAVMYEE